ncbi:hypothetical protein [Streptomyces lydicus]|uniref:hypothetical protein n=1 Tax=Streptomyces lydicus TaxID=47763 RepID=UPI00379A3315
MPDLHIHLRLSNPSADSLERLAAVLAELGAEPDLPAGPDLSQWTAERAARLIERVSPAARRLLRAAVDGDGTARGDDFRAEWGEAALAQPTKSISAIINSGARKGWWPKDIVRPLIPTGPDRRGWSKTAAYHMPRDLVPLFRTALETYESTGFRSALTPSTPPSAPNTVQEEHT